MERSYSAVVERVLARISEKDRESAREWILEKRASGLTGNSVRNYAFSLKALSEMCSKPLLECKRKDVMSLLVDVQDRYRDPGLYKHVLRDFLRSNGQEGLISGIRLNRRKSKKEWQDPAKVLGRDDIQHMLEVTTDLRDRAILAMLWDTGARSHEIAAVQLGDVKLEQRKNPKTGKPVYSVWFRKQKTRGEERRIPLYEASPFLLQWLNARRAYPDSDSPETPLFLSKRRGPISPLGTKGIRGIVKVAASKARIEKPCHPHSFRHARATFLKRRGTPDDSLRQWLGWTRGSPMPLRYVSRRAEEQIAEVADKLGYEPLPPPGPVEDLLPEDLTPEDIPLVTNVGFDVEKVKEEMMEEIIKRLQVHGSTSFDGVHVIVDKKDGPRKSQ
ncbi:MAG: site-specific integrase [Candidatus Thermoplasmatota archaeon]|nr:site-specific integrase [Candidatus Thermoplasmatota archaeon]